MKKYKKQAYILTFSIGSGLTLFLFYSLVELWFLNHRQTEVLLVHGLKFMLIFAGLVIGFFKGRAMWQLVYVEGRLDPFFKQIRKFLHMTPYKPERWDN